MNFLHKTLFRTRKSNILQPSNPLIYLYPSSVPYSSIPKKLARPSEIPFQPKVVNWVNLVGNVTQPIKFCTSADGKTWAGTVISQQRPPFFNSPSIWIPVIFEGDLAVTAVTHLKENDNVHVAGHLSSDRLPFNLTNDQVKVQVMVCNVHLVRLFPSALSRLQSRQKRQGS